MTPTEEFTFQIEERIPKNTDWWLKQPRDPVKGHFVAAKGSGVSTAMQLPAA
jgi:hypothetical protein